MIPRTFPSIVEAFQTKMVVYVVPSITGLKAWIDYIPVKGVVTESATLANTYANGGYQVVKSLDSLTGLQAWIGYIPVYEDASYNKPWSTDAGGYIPVGGLFSIPSLFASGAPGVWYDPSDYSTLFQDSAGTTPVTAVEQPVGRMLDKSGYGNHAFQATSASRPVLSARYNLLTKTEDFSDGVWTKTGATVTSNTTATTDPLGGNTADKLQETTANSFHYAELAPGVTVGASYIVSFYAKAAERTWCSIFGAGRDPSYFDLSNGVTGTAAANTTISMQSVGNGWYRCFYTATASFSTNTFGITSATGNNQGTYIGTTGSGIYIWGASVVPTNQSTLPYQRVNTATDYATTGFLPFLRFDGVDDSLSTNSISFTGTDKMSVFAGVRKLDTSANNNMIVELSSDMGAATGVFNLYTSNDRFRYGLKQSAAAVYDATTYNSPITVATSVIYDMAGAAIAQEVFPRINGAVPTLTVAAAGPAGTGNFGNYPLYIGRRNNASLPFNGQLYGLIVVGKAVTAGELSSAETYVNQKTGAY